MRHMEAFRAVMLNKTVTSAASSMCISQPVVTRLLAEFEWRIGIRLFERQRGRLHPTPEAKLLYEEVKQSLAGVERIADAAAEIRTLRRGSLRIAAAPSLALDFLPQTIGKFLERHPRAQIQLLLLSSQAVMERVREGRSDIGFIILSLQLQSSYCQLLMSTRMVCAIPAAHPLAQRDLIKPKDLQGERFVSYPTLLDTRAMVDAAFATHGVTRTLDIETQNSYAMLRLVEAGVGIALIDALTAACHQNEGVRFVPFEAAIPMNFSLMQAPDQTPGALQQPFIDFVRAEMLRRIPAEAVLYPER
ncbi:transcriptional regulator, LysR family [Castellaniella defragrans 65Phen]|uniref:Transcriptional regulator, LysR family n=1 Tax=Castellaniella defragrans (strain DSM 12143 / CCUG 39792 / 65Phen) TaxID=1437824 RepID=W8X5P0_CASD6|nr:transcriptional regulator, LysR family [Castellaniella defragrans 65Phen]